MLNKSSKPLSNTTNVYIVNIYACTYVYTCVCVCVQMWVINIYMYIYMYIYLSAYVG